MACTIEFIEEICSVLESLGEVKSRKMMGDYLIYVNEKCVITACDNIAYIKKLPCVAQMMEDAERGVPYPGAKEGYILDFSDPVKARKVVDSLWKHLPFPKSKNNKKTLEK
ncbi:MAG: transcriptional regulator [Muribaculaceae bacterium]|nr:transcriptional regulator [Muribaculaceae bacterium]